MTTPSSSTDSIFEAIVEEFLTEQDRGGNPDQRRYLERYPDQAEKLEKFFRDWNAVSTAVDAAKTEITGPQSDVVVRNNGNGNGNGNDGYHPSVEAQRFGPFRVVSVLGEGAQGIVYKAEQPGTGRHVALKVLRDGILASGAARQRFETEIWSVARLHHPNIVAIYECGQGSGHAYFAMELVEGQRIDTYVKEQQLSVRATVELFLHVCDALAYAHQQGVIHRDLKPSNIVVDNQGRPRVLDFGLAKLLGRADAHMTETGVFTGTFAYAAPEQLLRSNEVDTRADIYTLGLILYYLIAGSLPYDAGSLTERRLHARILELPFPSPAKFRDEIPDDLATVVLTALRKSPDSRYQSAAELAQDLRRFLRGEPIDAKRDSRWYLLRATARYYRWPLIAAAAVIAILVGFAATITVLYSKARTAQATAEARAEISRAGQAYIYRELLRLNRLQNMVAAFQEEHPHSRAVRRAQKPELTLATEDLSVLRTAPSAIFDSAASNAEPLPETEQWLARNAAILDQVAAQLDAGSLTFAHADLRTEFVDYTVATEFWWAQQLSSMFVARALVEVRDEDITSAVRYLESARLVAQDLGDGPHLFHKAASLTCRREQHGVCLHILGTFSGTGSDIEPLLQWIERDPPLPGVGLALMNDRMKAFQFAEASMVGTVPGQPGHLDLDRLNWLTNGAYANMGYLTSKHRAAAETLGPQKIVALLDAFAERPGSVRFDTDDPAALILGPMLGRIGAAERTIQQTESLRAASAAAARLCRFRKDHGRFPTELAELGDLPVDPATGLAFGYSPSPAVLLYSLNLDGIDHEGRCGHYGQPDTDVPLFQPSDRSLPECPISGIR